jgi:Predicted membrane protein (DUF2142)
VFNRIWVAAFGLFFALAAAWAVATPLGASPDEPAHMARAAAVSGGHITGKTVLLPTKMGDVAAKLRSQQVRVPKSIAALPGEITCYKFDAAVPASCTKKLSSSGTEVESTTYAGVYNPLYYLLVGWPVHLFSGRAGLYLMRLLSAALCAALMACAASIARGIGRVAFAGVVAAATPMALFLAGTVNPNSPEDAAGLLAWTALGAIALDRRPEALNRRLVYFALGAAVLATVRSSGIEWLVLLLCVAAILVPRRLAAEAVRRRPVWISAAALGAVVVLAALWNQLYGGLNLVALSDHAGYSLRHSIADSIHALPKYTQQLIGVLGWLDTPAPLGTVVAWLSVIGLLVLGAFTLATRREAAVLLVLLAGVVAIPIVANAVEAGGLGNLWQGRYLLWWVAGIPVLAAMVLQKNADRLPDRLTRRLPVLTVLVLAAGQLGMWWVSARRYGIGLGPKSSLLPLHTKWHPPGGWIPPTLLLLLGLAAMLVLAYPPRRSAGSTREGPRPLTEPEAAMRFLPAESAAR